jgi:hypothetical protein
LGKKLIQHIDFSFFSEYSESEEIDYNCIHKEVKTMDALGKKLLARLMAMAVIASLLAGLVMTGIAGGQPPTCSLDEDFSGSWLPSGWTQEQAGEWNQNFTNYAGGTSPEARLHWSSITGDYAYLDSKTVYTTGMSSLTLEFKSFIDYWEPGTCNFDCRVYTRAHGGDSWTDVTPWSNPICSYIGPGTYSVDISSDIGSATQVRFEFDGYYIDIDDWYVDDVKICGDVGPTLPYHLKYLHAEGGLIDLADPVGTQWHELWPFFCREYHLSSWNDTSGDGVLSHCDWIEVYEKPDGEVQWYHVENVTITLYVTPAENYFVYSGLDSPQSSPPGARQPMYIEHEGGYDPAVLTAPYSTYWHEIYPNFCTRYYLLDWADTNSTGTLNPCDHILLGKEDFDSLYLEGGAGEVIDNHVGTSWHVEEVAIDIIVTPEPPPVGGEAYPVSKASLLAPWIAVGVVLAGGISWHVLRRRKAQS